MDPLTAFPALILTPLLASPIIYLVGRIMARSGKMTPVVGWITTFILTVTLVPLFFISQAYSNQISIKLLFGTIALRVDGIGVLLAFTVLVLSSLVALFSRQYMDGEPGEEKYYALLVAMTGTIIGLGFATDLFNLWVWFEAMAISSVFLVAFYRSQPGSLEAGLKYLVQSAVGSVFVLIGIALIFAATGHTDLAKIQAAINSPTPILLTAGVCFVIGFGVKTAIVPLHTWLPDAHSQAPSGISAMLSGIVIEAGLVALLRTLGMLAISASLWGVILLSASGLNMLLGNLLALRQTEVKRILAFSSISHVGYMLLGFGAALITGSLDGAAGGFFHLINHALMKGLAFLSAGVLLYAIHLSHDRHTPLTIDDLNGASRHYPLPALAFSIAVFALGGLPPLSGFMSKWQIFVAGFSGQNPWLMVLVLFAALNSVLSLAYYAPLVNRLYRNQCAGEEKGDVPISWTLLAPLVLMTLAVIIIGFYPALLNDLTYPAAQDFLKIIR